MLSQKIQKDSYIPAAFFLSMPFPTQFSAAVTTVGSEKPSTLFTVFSIHGFSSSSSLLDSAILREKEDSSKQDSILHLNSKLTSSQKCHTSGFDLGVNFSRCFKTSFPSQTSAPETEPERYTGTGNPLAALWPAVATAPNVFIFKEKGNTHSRFYSEYPRAW